MKRFSISAACILAIFISSAVAPAAVVRDGQVEAELIPEVTAIQPGVPFTLALRLTHDPKWHTYWINDGDAGLATTIRWALPEGFEAGPIQWAYPERIEMPPLANFGYEDTVWLLIDITPPSDLEPGTEATLEATVNWLMCEDICIPGRARFTLNLPVRPEQAFNEDLSEAFAEARKRLPVEAAEWRVVAEALDRSIVLVVTPPDGFAGDLGQVLFFPEAKGIIQNAATQTWERLDGMFRMSIPRAVTINPLPERLVGVLVSSGDAWSPERQALAVNIAWGGDTAESAAAAPVDPLTLSLGLAALFAFIGGIILNLMPCVFPVISIKILGFVNQARESPERVWHHGLVFAGGVLVSFWLLAGLLVALRAGGTLIGWGFQLSSPLFVTSLIALFFLLALNLFGVFEVGLSLTSAGGEVGNRGGWSGSFFSGVLATIVATPCSAPLMGAAIGFALGQSVTHAMVIFTFLGLGMASPYLLLSRFPALLRRLPKPGPWMETLKQVMGFFLIATAVWLFWVLSFLVTPLSLSWLAAMLLGLAVGGWIYGKWGAIHRSRFSRIVASVLAVVLIGGSLYGGLSRMTPAEAGAAAGDGVWEPFTPERLAELREAGRPVFIDFTAKWCLTCQVNKQAVLQTADIQRAFAEHGVSLLVADWTDQNETVGQALSGLGRQSVPVYALYDAGSESPVLLPELLTRGIVLDALRNLN